jgi:hypothetical protein
MEDAIARLLPSADVTHDRALLLAELSDYARAVVCEARHIGGATPTDEERAAALHWLGRPVFICGHHRSGTTLLQELLDGHPELLVLPSEGTYFTSFSYAARLNPTRRDIDRFVADWVARFVDPNHPPHFKLGRSGPAGNPSVVFARRLLGWQQALQDTQPALAPFALLRALVAAFRDVTAASSSPRLWVEKTPLNERYARRFIAFSEARFIQLVREPSATLASLLEIYRITGIRELDPARHAQAIGQSLRLAQKRRQQFGSRYLIVRYEDLTDNPAQEMERVRAFLGISANPSLRVATIGGRPVRSNSSFERSTEGVIQRAPQSPALSPANARLVSAFTASASRPFGYNVVSLGVWARFRICLRQLPRNTFRHIRSCLRSQCPVAWHAVWWRPT